MGPGEVTTRAVVNKALGIERTIFVDVGDFGTRDVAQAARRAGIKVAATPTRTTPCTAMSAQSG